MLELLPEITSDLEENDVRVILYINYTEESVPHIKSVRVRAKDSDIFFILLYCTMQSHSKLLMSWILAGERLLSATDLTENYDQDHVSALLALHAFTGSDCTSAFKGKGKVRPIKIMNTDPKFIKVFARMSEKWSLEDSSVLEGSEEFTCQLYGSGKRVKC